MSKQGLIIDSYPIRLSLEENEGGKYVARGEFGRCDLATQNGRVYPRKVYEREIKKLQEVVDRRRMFGELDHPADGKTKLQRVSHLITKLELNDDGIVFGEAEILDTPNGKTLKAILEAGAEAGVSSRGFGSTAQGKNGEQIVGEDFILKTFDFVADPAMKSAYPDIFTEDVDESFDTTDFEESFPEVVEEIKERERRRAEQVISDMLSKQEDETKAEMRDSIHESLTAQLIAIREQVESDIRNELEEDPQIGGAKSVLSKIAGLTQEFLAPSDDLTAYKDALEAKELELSDLMSKNEELKLIARDLGMNLKLEQSIASHPKSANIRKIVGDPSRYSSMSELSDRIAELIEGYEEIMIEEERSLKARFNQELDGVSHELETVKEEYEARVSELEEELSEYKQMVSESESRARKAVRLAEGLEDKLREAEALTQKANRRAKASGYANSSELLDLIESVEDEDAVDEIISSRATNTMSDPALEQVRAKIRRGTVRSEKADLSEDNDEGIFEFNKRMFDDMTPSKLKQLSGL